jgi:hypothetical protein
VFALGQIVVHRRRLYRRDVVIDSGLSLSQAGAPRVLAPELAYFYRLAAHLSSKE